MASALLRWSLAVAASEQLPEAHLPEREGYRKVAGLRREEVASVAAISVDHQTRLEQGRVKASASVLSTLVRALRLDEDQQAYLYEIAGKVDALPRRRRSAEQVRLPVRRLLEQLGAVGSPSDDALALASMSLEA